MDTSSLRVCSVFPLPDIASKPVDTSSPPQDNGFVFHGISFPSQGNGSAFHGTSCISVGTSFQSLDTVFVVADILSSPEDIASQTWSTLSPKVGTSFRLADTACLRRISWAKAGTLSWSVGNTSGPAHTR